MKRLICYSYLALFAILCSATSVLQITFEELCQQAGLIFEGRVIAVDARKNDRSPDIWTYVTFDVIDVIKGPSVGDEIELAFMGGTIGDVGLQVASMQFPKLAETGIYFVESLARRQVNPLLGWTQGHYLVEPDEFGTKRVFTHARRPVRAIEPKPQSSQAGLSRGTPLGLGVGSAGARAITANEFIESISHNLQPR